MRISHYRWRTERLQDKTSTVFLLFLCKIALIKLAAFFIWGKISLNP